MNILEEIINSYQNMSIDKDKIIVRINKIKSESLINKDYTNETLSISLNKMNQKNYVN